VDRLMRNAPTLSVAVVLLIQLNRVADFGERIGAGLLAWVYAIFLAFSIYSLSYWTGRLQYDVTADPKKEEDRRKYSAQMSLSKRYERARFTSSVWLILFIFIDGSLNLTETLAAMPTTVNQIERIGAVIYGIFPTLAAIGLGSLQAMIDKLPQPPSKSRSVAGNLADKLLAALLGDDKDDKQLAQAGDKPDKQLAGVGDKGDKPLAQASDKPLLTDEALLVYLAQYPQASDGEAGIYFGKTRQAIQQRRKKLIERGAMAQAFAVQSVNEEVNR
jgi:hypothetical protein